MTSSPRERASRIEQDYRRAIISGDSPSLIEMVEEAIEDFKLQQTTPPICKEHPTYQGIRRPRIQCEGCWRLYLFIKDNK